MSETFTPRLYEGVQPKRGYFLLVPWMLIATLWLRLNTGISQGLVDFYFSLLVAGSISLVLVGLFEPRFNAELTKLKLVPFLTMYAVAFVVVFLIFATYNVLTSGHVESFDYTEVVWANKIAYTIFIVAPIETLVFQFIIPKLTTITLATVKAQTFGGFLSQVSFGLFHYAAYTHTTPNPAFAILSATVLGMVFYAIVRSSLVWGLGAAMGLHAGWNISVSLFPVRIFQDVLGGVF